MTAPTQTRTYKLGAVLPHVNRAAHLIGNQFGVATILGWRASARDKAGHPAGLALDFMCDRAQGDAINAFCMANAEALGIKYTIWQQTYFVPGEEPEPMEDRGSPTQNHMDHVHAQFTLRPGTGKLTDTSGLTPVGVDGYGPGDIAQDALAAALAPFDGWQGDLTGVAVKLTATAAALALVVAGVARTVTPGRTP